MIIKDIPFLIYNLISEFEENKKEIKIKKILYYNSDKLYFISFSIIEQTGYNSESINGSHSDYIIYQINSIINSHIINEKNISSAEIVYNFEELRSYKILVLIEKFIIENFIQDDELIYIDKKKYIDGKSEIIKKEKEETKKLILKHKLYTIIYKNPDGIDLGKIIQKSRSIKEPEIRKKILKELIDGKKISMEFDKSNGRNKRIYKPI